AGVSAVGEAVDHRHSGVRRQLEQLRLVGRAQPDERGVARQHPRRVRDRFPAPELRSVALQHHHLAAQLAHAHFERNPGARRRLLEDEGEALPLHGLAIGAAVPVLLEDLALLDNGPERVAVEPVKIEEVPQSRHALRLALLQPARTFSKAAVAVAISSSPMISGASSRTTLSPAVAASSPASLSRVNISVLGTASFNPIISPCPRSSSMI